MVGSGVKTARRSRTGRYVPERSSPIGKLLAFTSLALVITLGPWLWIRHERSKPAPPKPLAIVARNGTGEALANVRVRFFAQGAPHGEAVFETATNADGMAVLPVEHAAGDFYCVGECKGVVSQTWVSQSDPAHQPALELVAPEKVSGTVFAPSGLPVVGAMVEAVLAKGPPLETTKTGSDGHFELGSISTSLPFFTVRVRHPGYADEEQEWDRKIGEPMHFELVKTRRLRVRVVMPDGAPLAGKDVRVMGRRELDTRTDDRGFVAFEGIHPEERLFLQVDSGEHTFRNDGFSPLRTGQKIQLEAPQVLTGQVVDFEGHGMADVELRHRHGPRAWVRTRTDAFGNYSIGDVPTGKLVLHWEKRTGEMGTAQTRIGRDDRAHTLKIRIE